MSSRSLSGVSRTARLTHRWLSYLVFVQIIIWILGGLTFAVIPFDSVIKGGNVLVAPEPDPIPAGWWESVRPALEETGNIVAIQTHSSSQGVLLEVTGTDQTRWLRLADGAGVEAPDADQIARYARTLYAGDGKLEGVQYLDVGESRYLGLVDELYGRSNVWQVFFDDRYGTRFYFDGATGRYLFLRNDFWVFYDALWRLHIMDYADGEDFNNPLLRLLTPLALLFALSGLLLTISALRRQIARAR